VWVLLGATSEMCPFATLMAVGGCTVAAVARPSSRLQKLLDIAKASPGSRLLLPVPSPVGKAEKEREKEKEKKVRETVFESPASCIGRRVHAWWPVFSTTISLRRC